MNELHYQLDLLKAMNQKLMEKEKMYQMITDTIMAQTRVQLRSAVEERKKPVRPMKEPHRELRKMRRQMNMFQLIEQDTTSEKN